MGEWTAVAIRALSAGETPGFTQPFLVGEDRPALVVAPAPADLEIPRREPFAAEARLLHESQRALVRRLDVGLDAVQPQVAEREAQRQLHPFAHVTLTCERLSSPVAQVRVLERATDDARELEQADDRIVLRSAREQRVEVVRAVALDQPAEAGRVRRWVRPRAVQVDARLDELDELAPVARGWLAETNAPSHLRLEELLQANHRRPLE